MSEELSGSHFAPSTEVDFFGNLAYSINNLHAIVELDATLAIISEFDSFANIESTTIRRNFAKKHFEESGFTRTIFAYDAKFFVAREVIVEIIEYFIVAKGLTDILCLEYF